MKITDCLNLDDDFTRIDCPYGECEAVPHIVGIIELGAESGSSSGMGLRICFKCEEAHRWTVDLVDHSGSIWISAEPFHYDK